MLNQFFQSITLCWRDSKAFALALCTGVAAHACAMVGLVTPA